MRRVLNLLGYRCSFYSNPLTAVEAFRANPDGFDAVLSDVTMPLMSGLDVAKELHAIRRDVRLALTSGWSSQGIDKLPVYVKGWLSKPATIEEMSNFLEFLLADVTVEGSRPQKGAYSLEAGSIYECTTRTIRGGSALGKE
jgi:DNA-binding response OmpR family regulator